MHSFHSDEQYARKVGIKLGKLDIPYITVIESPRKRNYQRLITRYDAKWIIDLHNDTQKYSPEIKQLVAMLYLSSTGKPKKDRERKQIIRKWVRKNYSPHKTRVYPVSIIDKMLYDKPFNLIGVELYPHNKISNSVKFIKQFSDFLYDLD